MITIYHFTISAKEASQLSMAINVTIPTLEATLQPITQLL
jgi:hypothetical protein